MTSKTLVARLTGERMNPLYPQAARFYDRSQTAYVLFKLSDNRTRPTRILTSIGPLADVKIGTTLELIHDQDGKRLGEYQVVGIHDFGSDEQIGDVPDLNNILHCVVK